MNGRSEYTGGDGTWCSRLAGVWHVYLVYMVQAQLHFDECVSTVLGVPCISPHVVYMHVLLFVMHDHDHDASMLGDVRERAFKFDLS